MKNESKFDHFITRLGSNLMDGEEIFRFAGVHTPELHMIEDDVRGNTPDGALYFKLPTHEEQENWIKAQVQVGTKAQRTYVLSIEAVNSKDKPEDRPITHILAPTSKSGMPKLNEEAMVVYDNMIALADKYQLRLILPFIDHWHWWGGRKEIAAFYGEHDDAVYDVESLAFQAYKSIIEQTITRVNTITGRAYFEEKAIMAWETGNELEGTTQAFLAQISSWIKQLAPNQLMMDGSYKSINEYAIEDSNVDIISNHLYQFDDTPLVDTLKNNLEQIAGRKPYYIGEFGLVSSDEISQVMDAIADLDVGGHKAIGGLVWGGRGHRRDGGYYWHKEHTGTYSYHLPGFPIEGAENDEMQVVDVMRRAAARMAGLSNVPPLPVPDSPIMLETESVLNINWMGSSVGRYYDIERSESDEGPWKLVGQGISDGVNEWDPAIMALFSDQEANDQPGTYFYRAIAHNESGHSLPSNFISVTVE
ncbi:hypothetical protein FCV60_08870 [Vibrio sp. F13]|uniref:hypothetical protein n=1 Tax=Vibrio sp. F13 TaxID=2070777 RepID=UPI0010BE10B6|nr:hypothetical protein [Vibrio sp. F13]TKF54664.1 hypothetical protein FCV60_08870 [Vibrio sp. F13]